MKEHKLEDKFNPKNFEEEIYKRWEEKEYFKPSEDKTKKPYTIVIPPPNITGKLHMGHALDETLQDILIRYKRMEGYNCLWLPGTDHAAIATEVKIVEKLKQQGIEKKNLTREQFLEKAWEWKKEYGGTILNQLKKLGCSCDWSRERFTMDEGLSNAVKYVFIKLYEKGLIYKGKRMINWCPSCNTSISDAEVEFEEEPTHLWHIRYKVKDEDKYLIVATTRPETMLGDTGVAVHPEDERYKDLVGKKVILPIMNKEIPIVADDFVEKEFGTGAVKLTPAHDPNDYAASQRHNLEIIEVFDENWKMGNLVPEYKGLDIYEARKRIVEKLQEIGALVKIEDYTHNVGKCYRCHHTIEPKISEQWFVKMKPLAEPAIKAVKDGKTRFIPERFDKIYYNWMDNIQDWCISRQLWWGHRIPAYYCTKCNNIMVTESIPHKCEKCGNTEFTQDEDTLDTWFSSALWPFSTLGWPEQTEDLKYFYPTSTLVTGYDIIFFWVARMIFSAIEHTGEVPFKDVFIHGIVRDSLGRKMSKSLGNGIDPLEIIEKYGTDALRFSLVLGISPGNDIRYMPEKLESAANFANKLWNASKFVLGNLEEIDYDTMPQKLCYEDKWILSKLNKLIKETTINLNNYDLGVWTQKVYDFIWGEFCDWYIEMVKPRLYDKENKTREAAQYTLNKVLGDSLKLLHPIMPFITEEIYTKLYNNDESIMISSWPQYSEEFNFAKEEKQIEKIKQIIIGIRNIRTNMNVHPAKKSTLIFVTENDEEMIIDSQEFIKKLGFADKIIVQGNKNNIPQNAMSVLSEELEVYLPFDELVDIEEEKKRLQGEKQKLEAEVERASKMLSNPGFVNKAPENKIKEEKEKLERYKQMLENVEERLSKLA
ncbi:MAG TPA: valine--tRNA ligase [Clostridiaceae bacterium]|jgi:valyl-tRNA synthetase|nr:valine--tRNA ligase [Clostridiaceae bacterium]